MLQAWTLSAPSLKAWCLREFLINAAPTRPPHALLEPWCRRAFHPFRKGAPMDVCTGAVEVSEPCVGGKSVPCSGDAWGQSAHLQLSPMEGAFERLKLAVLDRVPSGKTSTLRPCFNVSVNCWTAFSDDARFPRSTNTVPANSFNFPSSGTFLTLALLKNTMGVGLAAKAALMSSRLVWLATSTTPCCRSASAWASG